MALPDEVLQIGTLPEFAGTSIHKRFAARAKEGNPTRDEDPQTHFCVYFLPYNPATKEVFIVHHKKSRLWLSPGGHIDKGETLLQTLEREMREELGLLYKASNNLEPFLLTTTPVDNAAQPCKLHYDVGYAIQTDGSDFRIDPTEFHQTRWFTVAAAREFITDAPNLDALAKIQRLFQ